MAKDKKNNLHRFFLVFVLAFGLLLRVVLLDVIPPGLANDEANIILNAQSLLKTGNGIPGVVMGIFGTPTGDYISGAHSELSSYFLSFVYFFSGFSFSTSRLPFALASLGVAVFLYLISKELFGEKVSKIVLILAIVNPWLIQFGRAGYESIISAFFYFAGIYVFLKTDKWKKLYSLPLLLMGFFCYFSAKVLLLPVSISLLAYELLSKSKNIKVGLVLNLLVILFLAIYYPILKNSYPGQRLKELSGNPYATVVDFKRTHSIEFPLVKLTENKVLENVFNRSIASLGGLSPTFIFLNGQPETSGHLQIPDHGPMYLLDFLFVIFGVIYLSHKDSKKLTLFLLLIASSLLPNFFDIAHTTHSMRPVILIPILIIISGLGISYFLEGLKNRKTKYVFTVLLILSYSFLFTRFVFNYYYRLPIENSGTFYFHDRITTRYIQGVQRKFPEKQIVWVVPERHFTMYRYIYFSGLYSSKENIKSINKLLEEENYHIGSLTIEKMCPQKISPDTVYIIDRTLKCEGLDKTAVISNINDAGEQYYLASDPLCQGQEYRSYPLIRTFSLLRLDQLTDQKFCTNYVLKQN